MEKKKRGRPSIPIELKKQHRTAWMLNSKWYCDICNMVLTIDIQEKQII